jgi:hypothetical protein
MVVIEKKKKKERKKRKKGKRQEMIVERLQCKTVVAMACILALLKVLGL